MNFSSESFGFLIAYLIPGFVLVWGMGQALPELNEYMRLAIDEKESVLNGILGATIAAIVAGLLVDGIRCLTVDGLIKKLRDDEKINYDRLSDPDCYQAHRGAINHHYRYYQYYGNILVASTLGLVVYLINMGMSFWIFIVILVALYVMAHRAWDSIVNYNKKALQILNQAELKKK